MTRRVTTYREQDDPTVANKLVELDGTLFEKTATTAFVRRPDGAATLGRQTWVVSAEKSGAV
jgi:hypothetical protein